MMLATTPQNTQIISPESTTDNLWLNYFNPQDAINSVIDHVESLPSSRTERHTMRAYLASIADYCAHLGAAYIRHDDENYSYIFNEMRMPTRANTTQYIADCKRRGLSSKTITRYLASIRHFIRALEEQDVIPQNGSDFVFIMQAQRQLKLAASTKNPKSETTSNRPALEQTGIRLTLDQINRLFNSFWAELDTLTGMRDLALLYTGITSGLRAAELARITPASITQGDDCYLITVRGKRGNSDPVGIDSTAYQLIMDYINAWNDRADDERQITDDTPIWQPILRGDHLPQIGLRNYQPANGLTPRAILQIVERRSMAALGFAITAHDMRRTCASVLRDAGTDLDAIRDQLRHRSVATTDKYIGRKQNYARSLLSLRVNLSVPGQNK